MCVTLSKFKLELARSFNKIYNNTVGVTPDDHRKAWNEIQESCAKHGIALELIQVSPEVFELIAKRPVIKEYFI